MDIQEDQLVHAALENETLIPIAPMFEPMDIYISGDIKGSNQLANLLKWLENRRQDTATTVAQKKGNDKYWFMGAAAAFQAVINYIFENMRQ